MKKTGTTKTDDYNKPIYGLHGAYKLSESVELPYFSASLPIERTIDELRIAEEVPPSLDNQWSLGELFQREIDQKRAAKEIVNGYLADPKKLKFFNALTVVLMPKSTTGEVLDDFQAHSSEHESPPIPYAAGDKDDAQWASDESVAFGGVQYTISGDQARLRWDQSRVHAVTVDGQHRLFALREYRNTIRQRTLTPRERETKIPVLFLLLHDEVGFVQGKPRRSIRTIARELFTDLNKNAKQVDRARELILDDWSLDAQCVRHLITSETATDEPDVIPLSLVRWQDANNRFDQSYFLTSLVHLESLVGLILDVSPPKDPLDTPKVEHYIRELGKLVSPDKPFASEDGIELLAHYRKEYCEEDSGEFSATVPFSRLPPAFLSSAVSGFDAHHRTWLLKLLLESSPYATLLEYAREHDLIEGVFGKFHAQTFAHRGQLKKKFGEAEEGWYSKNIDVHIEHIEGAKKANWAFKAIFQKALVRLGRSICFDNRTDATRLGDIEELIGFVDDLAKRGLLKIDAELPGDKHGVWTWIGTNPGNGKIKVSKTVETTILSQLRIWYYARRLLKTDGSYVGKSGADIAKHFRSKTSTALWPDCNEATSEIEKSFRNKTFLGEAVAKGDDGARKTQEKAIRERVASLLGLILT